ncbi:MAG: cation:proton antiporter [Firmicutes bacterium]|nr:cation:proton antiporter [Bacillota bacterium]
MQEGTTMIPSMFLINIALILIFTKIGGMIGKRLGVPSVLGQVLTGIILGPTLLGVVKTDLFLEEAGQIGVIMLLFLAGLDTEIKQMKSIGKQSMLVALGGVLIPFCLGTLVTFWFKQDLQTAVFVGTILTATSVSITVQTLMELGKLKTIEGNSILTAAVIDDIIGILILAVIVGAGSNLNIFGLIGMIILFFISITFFGRVIFPFLLKLSAKYEIREGRVTLALACCLFFAWLADNMGVAAIIGAYLMGIFIGQTKIRNLVSERIQIIGYAFFIPIFFVGIGAGADFHQIGVSSLILAITIVLTAIISKIVGSMIGALIGGFSLRRAVRIGVGMIPRGEVALIITSLGIRKGIIGNDIFSATLMLVLISTIITPLLLSLAFKEPAPENQGV